MAGDIDFHAWHPIAVVVAVQVPAFATIYASGRYLGRAHKPRARRYLVMVLSLAAASAAATGSNVSPVRDLKYSRVRPNPGATGGISFKIRSLSVSVAGSIVAISASIARR